MYRGKIIGEVPAGTDPGLPEEIGMLMAGQTQEVSA
jgi:hypothetical protein